MHISLKCALTFFLCLSAPGQTPAPATLVAPALSPDLQRDYLAAQLALTRTTQAVDSGLTLAQKALLEAQAKAAQAAQEVNQRILAACGPSAAAVVQGDLPACQLKPVQSAPPPPPAAKP